MVSYSAAAQSTGLIQTRESPLGTVASTRRRTLRQRIGLGNRGGLAGYIYIAPSLVLLPVFVIIPVFGALYYSLTDYDLMRPPSFAGLKNYRNLTEDARYLHATTNTLLFAFGTVPSGVAASLALAVLINRQIRSIYTFRALF